ncbi:chloride channel protein [Anaeramoeba flamelloides]|uniref:Chloride channel protein n=1 Tax=Anaeramoeba flamelloides TaxID=1746091 RepID=A0AAV7ZE13_9EUKA|nr:chloride channel protein [Anaeramoeba flamelloides]KAJ6231906.1 chloride channel protein [Anaeramoeba flamelloides]
MQKEPQLRTSSPEYKVDPFQENVSWTRRKIQLKHFYQRNIVGRIIMYFTQEKTFLLLFFISAFSTFLLIGVNYVLHVTDQLKLWLFRKATDRIIEDFLFFLPISIILSLISTYAASWRRKGVIGSGIPEIKTILGGAIINNWLSFPTLILKLISFLCAYSGGLIIDKVGPYIHMSAIIASLFCGSKLFGQSHWNDDLYLEILSASVSIGLSATFGAPLAGFLFSIELSTTLYKVSSMWQSVFAIMISIVLIEFLGFRSYLVLFTTDFNFLSNFSWKEVFICIIVGFVCGVLGAGFILFTRKIRQFLETLKFKFKSYVLVAIVATLNTAALAFSGLLHYNDQSILDLLFAKHLLRFTNSQVLIIFLVKFVFVAINSILPLSGGIFIPVFISGAAIGRVIGEILSKTFPALGIEPARYALLSAAALTSGVTHSMSTALIILELTHHLPNLIPLLISVIIAIAVSSSFSVSIYDLLVILRELPFLPVLMRRHTHEQTARSLLRNDVPTLVIGETTFRDVQHILQKKQTFPIYPVIQSSETPKLIGVVDSHTLDSALINRAQQWEDILVKSVPSISEDPNKQQRKLNQIKQKLFDKPLKFTSDNLGVIRGQSLLIPVNRAPFQMNSNMLFGRIAFLFFRLNLSSAIVTDKGIYKGIIFQNDILHRY